MTKKDAMRAAVEALEFYANPNVYEPDSIGRRQDIRYVAESALSLLRSALEEGAHPMRNGYAGSVLTSADKRHRLTINYDTREQADAAQEWLSASPTADKEQP